MKATPEPNRRIHRTQLCVGLLRPEPGQCQRRPPTFEEVRLRRGGAPQVGSPETTQQPNPVSAEHRRFQILRGAALIYLRASRGRGRGRKYSGT